MQENLIEIWEPHWHSRCVYIATFRVKDGLNRIHFTGVPKMPRPNIPDLVMDGDDIRQFPLGTNGKIAIYKVPLTAFAELTEQEKLL